MPGKRTQGKGVLNLTREGRSPRRPWALQKDGDLWELFYNIVVRKGPNSIKLVKRRMSKRATSKKKTKLATTMLMKKPMKE